MSERVPPPPAPQPPIDALPALRATESRLLELLADVTARDWDQPTIVPGWAALLSLMRPASAALCAHLESRDAEAPAAFPVSWATGG